ncbi:MAG: hypothetical protein DRO96_01110 [Candidatus Aenigmatarchaeota archaeon]|nr:MAG: hypothetical protein DRO96_01110 [Candidatus Aenigmarchaeota archaeon]
MGKGDKPEKKFSTGEISATVWNNKVERDGKPMQFRTVSFQKRYKDNDGEWRESKSLKPADLPKAVLVLNKAYEYLVLKKDRQDNDIVIEEEPIE